jgi:lysyl-tRNA synthetase class 2
MKNKSKKKRYFEEIRKKRIQKLDLINQLKKKYCEKKVYDDIQDIQSIKKSFLSKQSKKKFVKDKGKVKVAGRILQIRPMGKVTFLTIFDQIEKIQLYLTINLLKKTYKNLKLLDIGDIILAKGILFKTKTNDFAIKVLSYSFLTKSIRPLPSKWHGLIDKEKKYRKRYLDLIINNNSKKIFIRRSMIIKGIREFLWKKNFIEVETPTLCHYPEGANAKPFYTHSNFFNHNLYLRIAPEIYLKKLLIGGLKKIFEMGKVYRNEGVSLKHSPEFTMVELYQSYSSRKNMLKLIKELIFYIYKKVLKSPSIKKQDGSIININSKWKEISYKEIIKSTLSDKNWFQKSLKEKKKACINKFKIKIKKNLIEPSLTKKIFEKIVVPTIIQPTFIKDFPRELYPLAKINKKNTKICEVSELYINGIEIAPIYSEQNDPFEQKKNFERQEKDSNETLSYADKNFLNSIEYGMPPASGAGIGIDRLCMILTNLENIKDIILFPQLRKIK